MNIETALNEIQILVDHSDNASYKEALKTLTAATTGVGVAVLNLNDVDILDEAMTEWLDDTQLTDHLTDLGIAASTKINNLREGLLFN